jgi:hypothetical protein
MPIGSLNTSEAELHYAAEGRKGITAPLRPLFSKVLTPRQINPHSNNSLKQFGPEMSTDMNLRNACNPGHCCKVSDEAAFVLFKGLFKNSAYQAHFAQGITIIKCWAWPLRSARITSIFDGGVSRLHGFKSQRGADYPFQFCHDRIQSRCSGT